MQKSKSIGKRLVFLAIILLIAVSTATAVPAHALTGYWHNFNNGSTVLRLRDVPTSYDIVAIAFADATGSPGQVDFTLDSTLSSMLGGYTKANFKSDVSTLKGRGQTVIISVGGQNGFISVTSSSAASNFANSINSLKSEFGFQGVDIDLENGVSATYMGQALRSISGTKTMAPQTIDMQNPAREYFKLALSDSSIICICSIIIQERCLEKMVEYTLRELLTS